MSAGEQCVVAPRAMIGRGIARRVETFLVAHRARLKWVHLTFFVAFLAIILGPLALPDPPEHATPLDNLTELASYVLWGLWFPLVFLSVLVTGRSWCGLMCPMGAASELANRHGLRRPIPRWVRWEWLPVVSFVVITVLGQTVGVRDHPEAAAQVFGGTMLLAIAFGLIWGRLHRRAWCRHACPIGLLLGIFSRLGAVQLAPKVKKPGGDRYTERGLCPTMIDISRKEESRHCIECFRCVEPRAKGGLEVRLRMPGEEVEAIRGHRANPVEVWFLFIGTGIALGGFLWLVLPLYQELRQAFGIWAIEHEWYWVGEPGPWWLMSVHPDRREVFLWLDFSMITAFMTAFAAMFAAALAATTAAGAWLAGRAGGDRDFRTRFVELGYQYAPVAMISLVIGLGGELFDGLDHLGLGAHASADAKAVLFVAALAWSLWLGNAILRGQGLAPQARVLPLAPGLLGSLAVGGCWWIAIFGL